MSQPSTPLVLVVMGSTSDQATMAATTETLEALGVPFDVQIRSAHRTPTKLLATLEGFEAAGGKVIIAGAGLAAHLAGACAAQTVLPVIAVPLAGSDLGGFDALLSSVQMPKGVPVATVAIGRHGAVNAALLAGQMLALSDPSLGARLKELLTTKFGREL